MSKDYYAILGLSKSATAEEIKKAFREKAHKHHPDKGGGDEAKFKEANEAYQVLKDPAKRQQYDQFGSAFNQAGGGAGGFNWQDFARAQQGANQGGVHFDMGDLGDIFGEMFGGGRRGSRQTSRGADMQIEMTIDFHSAVFGGEEIISLEKQISCEHCGGHGTEPGSQIVSCKTCGGRGQVERVVNSFFGAMRTAIVCPDCHGQGRRAEKPCRQCNGQGVKHGSEKIKIKIPAGIDHGQTIRLSGKGQAAAAGRPSGDLLITFRVRADKRFTRRGADIFTQEKISFRQAALGDKITIATIHGDVVLKIPAGTQTGSVFKLREKGVPHLGRSSNGDHLVEVIIATPTHLSRSQKKALEDLD